MQRTGSTGLFTSKNCSTAVFFRKLLSIFKKINKEETIMSGVLTLIPTPIDEESPLEQTAFELLNDAVTNNNDKTVIAIEDLKPGRRRWLRWGLPRETVENFVLYNEHSAKEVSQELLGQLQNGKNVFIMSDGGLPAFCDPGIELVDLCHKHEIKVTATPFANSISLALALSGFSHQKFVFEGFLPRDKSARKDAVAAVLKENRTTIIMDTPYRLKKVLEEFDYMMSKHKCRREVFVALDLNSPTEELVRGLPGSILKKLESFKREFIFILSPRGAKRR